MPTAPGHLLLESAAMKTARTLLAAVPVVLRHPLRVVTHRTLFGLLAATGMREGEAIGLDRDDVDLDAGYLTIRDAKFNKSRQIPLHSSAGAALRESGTFTTVVMRSTMLPGSVEHQLKPVADVSVWPLLPPSLSSAIVPCATILP